ncbi:Tellurite resistance TerB [Rhodovastum atsumiense]|uniref:Tellurite resistance TerB n=1 Tax=Rhodovastum atsumiense TaxID=504468 RepID=A0A5M6IPS5_9PROT|nr:tellurite resistance TerB family protein [Rhodovastum atsumiense]KAA5610284.1 Tellurite resistance TerB [Rhodovastum atsumiense]CAH2602229.1 Tellurite resistance TerB [Rhodovastum atsumiense]
MTIWDTLTNTASSIRKGLSDELSRYRSQGFLDAVAAACALVSTADGSISAAEKEKMLGFIRQSDELKVFDLQTVIDTFTRFAGKIEFDFALGASECLATIGKLKGKTEARLLVRVCIAVAGADGSFSDDEKKVVRNICTELGIDPKDFDL